MQKMNKIIILSLLIIMFTSFTNADTTINNQLYYSYDSTNVSGATMIDLSSNTNNGVCTNMGGDCNTGVGLLGNSTNLVLASSQYIATTDHSTIDIGSSDLSFGGWIYIDVLTNDYYIQKQDQIGSTYNSKGYGLRITGAFKFGCEIDDGADHFDIQSSTVLTANTWIHVVCVIDRDNSLNSFIYVNGSDDTGSRVGTIGLVNGISNNDPLEIGRFFSGGTPNYFDGKVDETFVTNRTYNSTEVGELWNNSYGYNPYNEPSPVSPTNTTYFKILANSYWDNSAITKFNATINGTAYTTTNGTIQTNINQSLGLELNITVWRTDRFDNNIINYNTSINLTAKLKQSEINISFYKEFEGIKISNYNFTVDGMTFNVPGDSKIIYPDTNNYNVTNIVDNNGIETYTLIDDNFSVTELDNKTINLSVAGHIINIFVKSLVSGLNINNFTTRLVGLNFTDNRTNITNTGLSSFRVNDGNFNISIDASGFALVNNSIILVVNNSKEEWNYTFYLYTTNSINITFRDILTNQLLNGTNITVNFIGNTPQVNNTLTGGLYVDLLSPSEYTILYTADNYRQGSYILTVTNRSSNELTLYMSTINTTQLVLLKVRDEFNSVVKNANVIVQRYINTGWVTEQIIKTDFNGQSEAYYVISTQFYNHLVTVNGQTVFGVINSNEDKKTIYAEDVANGLTITVNLLVDSSLPTFFNSEGLTQSINYTETSNTTGYFTYRALDPDGNQHDFNLEVYKTGELLSVCNNTARSSSAILTCSINETSGNRVNYIAKGKVDGFIKITINKIIGAADTRIDWGVSGYIFAFFVMVIVYFSYLASPTISLWLGTIFFVGFSLMGLIFKDMSYGILMIVVVLTYLVATIKSESGVNS